MRDTNTRVSPARKAQIRGHEECPADENEMEPYC